MTTFGLTDTGLVIKRLADIKTEMEEDYKSVFGAAVNLDPESPFGHLIGIQSEREAFVWELMEQIYLSRNPERATGLSLDNALSINNINRLAATYSKGTITITGTAATVVPAGFVVSVVGNTASRFVTTAEAIIEGGGTVSAAVQAETTGPIQAPSGTLTVIETQISGVTSVTNALDITIGRNTETDTEARIRRLILLNRPGTASINGIRAALLEVLDVVQANVIENDTGSVDIDGRPAHSIEAIVSGGTAADIAAALLASVAAGIETYGTYSETVNDDQGITHVMKFSRPIAVPVYLRITITPNTDANEGDIYPSNGDDAIKLAVTVYATTKFTLGKDVILSQLSTPINTVAGVFGIVTEISLNGSAWQSTNLVIDSNELATFDTSRITVVS